MPGGAAPELAAEVQRLRESEHKLKEEVGRVGNIAREEALRHAEVLRARDRVEYDEYRKYYEEKAEQAKEQIKQLKRDLAEQKRKTDLAENLAGKLMLQLHRLKGGQTPSVTGGAGGATAVGGDGATVTTKTDSHDTNIKQDNHFNITVYGTENFDPSKFSGMVGRLLQSAELAEDVTSDERLIRDRVLEYGVHTMARQPENRVLKGFDEEKDTVGVLKAPDDWEQRDTREVTKDYAKRIGPNIWPTAPRFKEMKTPEGKELDEWVEESGTRTVRRVAKLNEEDERRGKMTWE
jgi:hypothetical protein